MIDKSCKATECKTCNEADCIWRPCTNADRIRAMTDDKLAEFMNDVAQRGGIPIGGNVIKWLNWLKQEVE